MPCMGPTRDHETSKLVTRELSKIDSLNWDLVVSVWDIERAIDRARKELGHDISFTHLTRVMAGITLGLLYKTPLDAIDWVAFETKLSDILWQFDAADF